MFYFLQETEEVDQPPVQSQDFIAAPPPQFDNSPPDSMNPAAAPTPPPQQRTEERLVNLDEEILSLEREVLGEEEVSGAEEIIQTSAKAATGTEDDAPGTVEMIQWSTAGDTAAPATVETTRGGDPKPNQHYVYGEEGAEATTNQPQPQPAAKVGVRGQRHVARCDMTHVLAGTVLHVSCHCNTC